MGKEYDEGFEAGISFERQRMLTEGGQSVDSRGLVEYAACAVCQTRVVEFYPAFETKPVCDYCQGEYK